MIWFVLSALGAAGLGAVLVGTLISRRAENRMLEERLGIDTAPPKERRTREERPAPLTEALDRALVKRGIGADLATQLARADLKLTVAEFVAVIVILVLSVGVVTYLWRQDVIITTAACLMAFFAPRAYVGVRRGQRLKAFNDQLGDTLNLLVNSIRAGYSILQAMRTVSEEMSPPISSEFGRVVQEVQLGISLEEALAHMLRRVPSDDLDMVVTAMNIQREVGGNLAEILDSISFTVRERIRIKGEIRTLTAQSRISGYMVAAVPVILAGIIYMLNPEFIGILFEHTCGHIMIGAAVLGIAAGFLVMRKVVDIDI